MEQLVTLPYRGLAEVADVVNGLGHGNHKAAIAWDVKRLTRAIGLAGGFACQRDAALALQHFHDFGGTGVKGQGGRQNHADRLFGAVCKGDAVADAAARRLAEPLKFRARHPDPREVCPRCPQKPMPNCVNMPL